MRRSLMSMLGAALGFAIACGSDGPTMGVRSDGVTVWCNQGEYYYECTPDYPDRAPPGADEGSGSGSDTQCGPDTYPCPDDGSGGGGDGSGSGSGSGGGGGGGGSGSGAGGGSGSGGGGGSGSGTCGPDTFPCDGGGDQCQPWPVGTATVLWPPNHKMHTYTLADCAKVDVCPDGSSIAAGTVTKITVDEEIDVGRGGDGHTLHYDARIIDATHFELRSERQGGMDGRVYTVYYTEPDGTAGSCQFLVPHNRGPHEGAVDSGTKVEILP